MLILFFLLWVIFNGKITLEITLFGIAISFAVFGFMCKYMGHSVKGEIGIYKNTFRMLSYLVVLVVEIFKANYAVIRLIVSSKYEIEPVLVKFKTNLKKDKNRVLLANSITLTPGTITVLLEEDEYLVHCLDKDFSYGLDDSVFVHLLTGMEEKEERTKAQK